MSPDPYPVLGVSPSVNDGELRRAYLKLARRYHPDSQPAEKRASAERRMQEINAAWALVSDPDRRAAYDRKQRGDTGQTQRTASGFKADYGSESDRRRRVSDPTDAYWTDGAGSGIGDPTPYVKAGTSGRSEPLTLVPPGLFLGGLGLLVVGLVVNVSPLMALGMTGMLFSVVSFLMLSFVNMAKSRQSDRR